MSDSTSHPQRWLKLTVAYDGTNYAGWQFQPRDPTVQATLAGAWQAITGEQPAFTASGRTDAGVHAWGQVVGIATESKIPCEQLLRALNAKLPKDVLIRRVEPAPDRFHATYDALHKLYRYQIHNARTRPLFDRGYRWHFPQLLDVSAMRAAGAMLVGRHDFSSFETAGSERNSTVRTLMRVDVGQGGATENKTVASHCLPAPVQAVSSELIEIDVQGDGFLYNMVRGIVGTLLEVGRGARQPEWIRQVLAAHDRRVAGPNAPAHGLMLMEVKYAEEIDRTM